MNVQIRASIFETNSSSMHSIAIKKEHHKVTLETFREENHDFYIEENGKCLISYYDTSFGRSPFRALCTVFEKALYIIAEDMSKMDEVYKIIRKYCPEFTEFVYPISRGGFKELGLIEESCGTSYFIKSHNITLEEFLTDSAYIIFIDGNEYYALSDFIEKGIIDRNNFEEIEYTEPNERC